MFHRQSDYGFNNQSTYLYSLLNGFSLEGANTIRWIDAPRHQVTDLQLKTRKNVFNSEDEWTYRPTKIQCGRKWSFTRTDKI